MATASHSKFWSRNEFAGVVGTQAPVPTHEKIPNLENRDQCVALKLAIKFILKTNKDEFFEDKNHRQVRFYGYI